MALRVGLYMLLCHALFNKGKLETARLQINKIYRSSVKLNECSSRLQESDALDCQTACHLIKYLVTSYDISLKRELQKQKLHIHVFPNTFALNSSMEYNTFFFTAQKAEYIFENAC